MVTTGGRACWLPSSCASDKIASSTVSSLEATPLWPISSTTNSAVSWSITSLSVAITPMPISTFNTSPTLVVICCARSEILMFSPTSTVCTTFSTGFWKACCACSSWTFWLRRVRSFFLSLRFGFFLATCNCSRGLASDALRKRLGFFASASSGFFSAGSDCVCACLACSAWAFNAASCSFCKRVISWRLASCSRIFSSAALPASSASLALIAASLALWSAAGATAGLVRFFLTWILTPPLLLPAVDLLGWRDTEILDLLLERFDKEPIRIFLSSAEISESSFLPLMPALVKMVITSSGVFFKSLDKVWTVCAIMSSYICRKNNCLK